MNHAYSALPSLKWKTEFGPYEAEFKASLAELVEDRKKRVEAHVIRVQAEIAARKAAGLEIT